MEPLYQIDSAISVATKDIQIQDGPPPRTAHQPPSNSSQLEAQADAPADAQADDEESLLPVSITSLDQPSTRECQGTQKDNPPVTPSTSAMENLVPPLDQPIRSPERGRLSPWNPNRVRLPTPPTYAAHLADADAEETAGNQGLDALAQAESGAIAIDHDEIESDAGYESDRASFASTSLSSSVRDYLYENGRRYHRFREGRYNFPNDEAEQDREDMKHACVKMLCQQQLYFAPIDERKVQNILDIGTGTGIWAIEMGDQLPGANIVGIDLSPIQPEWVPSNVHFVIDDAESDWVYPPDHFDYIHTRHTVMAIKDWPKLYRTAKEHIKPGGWIESQEIYHYPISANNSMPPDHSVAQYWALINQGLSNLGIDFHAAAGGKIAAMMREAGFENVHEQTFHVPLGTWPKHPNLKTVGEYWRYILLMGAQAIALGPLTRGCGWTREQVEVFLIDVRKAYYDNSCLMYMPMHIVYGQKPVHGF